MSQSYLHFRLVVTDFRRNGSAVDYCDIGELSLYNAEGKDIAEQSGATYSASSTASANTDAMVNAFDGSASTYWQSDWTTTNSSRINWLQVTVPTAVTLASVGITPHTKQTADFPWAFRLDASNDGTTWDTLLEEDTEGTGWTAGVERVFEVFTPPAYYSILETLRGVKADAANPTKIEEGSTAVLHYSLRSGYELPASVGVTGSAFEWDATTSTLTLSSPTENVAIDIEAAATAYEIPGDILSDIADIVRTMVGTNKGMTPAEMLACLEKVMFIPQGQGESILTLASDMFDAIASGELPAVYTGTANSVLALSADMFATSAVGEVYKYSYTSSCAEVTSDTTLTSSVDCGVGDLVIAAIVTRDTLELSDGWTLISTSDVNSADTTNDQRLSFAYKYAESESESITVTQASAQRLYINLVALQGATGYTDNGYSYVDSASASASVTKPSGLVLWACSAPLWSTSSPYATWSVSNDSPVLSLGTSTQSRLAVVLDQTSDATVTFTPAASSTIIIGSLSIEGMSEFWKIE